MASRGNQLPLALELLESDHRKVEMLFDQYEDNKEGEEEMKRQLAERICGELTVHAQVEEELFYPWLRETLDEDDQEMVEEAQVEHNGAKDLIAQIEAAEDVDATYDAMVKVLSEYIKHHVKEEENEIFPEVASEGEELDELGQELAARKAELMAEAGIEGEEEMPDMSPAARKGSAQAQRDAARRSR